MFCPSSLSLWEDCSCRLSKQTTTLEMSFTWQMHWKIYCQSWPLLSFLPCIWEVCLPDSLSLSLSLSSPASSQVCFSLPFLFFVSSLVPQVMPLLPSIFFVFTMILDSFICILICLLLSFSFFPLLLSLLLFLYWTLLLSRLQTGHYSCLLPKVKRLFVQFSNLRWSNIPILEKVEMKVRVRKISGQNWAMENKDREDPNKREREREPDKQTTLFTPEKRGGWIRRESFKWKTEWYQKPRVEIEQQPFSSLYFRLENHEFVEAEVTRVSLLSPQPSVSPCFLCIIYRIWL